MKMVNYRGFSLGMLVNNRGSRCENNELIAARGEELQPQFRGQGYYDERFKDISGVAVNLDDLQWNPALQEYVNFCLRRKFGQNALEGTVAGSNQYTQAWLDYMKYHDSPYARFDSHFREHKAKERSERTIELAERVLGRLKKK